MAQQPFSYPAATGEPIKPLQQAAPAAVSWHAAANSEKVVKPTASPGLSGYTRAPGDALVPAQEAKLGLDVAGPMPAAAPTLIPPMGNAPSVGGQAAAEQRTPLPPPTPTGPGTVTGNEETQELQIQLEPPGPERLFRLESENSLHERMRQEARQRPVLERISFPVEPVLSKEPFTQRVFPPATEVVEPNYVCYGRLHFEEKNSERYGWDLGFVQPFLSAGTFYWDVLTLPYHCGTEPCRKFECSAGYCLPGDPVPYLLYPPELSLTGAVFEAGAIGAVFAIFPG